MEQRMKIVAGSAALVGSGALVAWLLRNADPNRINDSVGRGGRNRPEDVKVVRRLLGALGYNYAHSADLEDVFAGLRIMSAILHRRHELGEEVPINRASPLFKLIRVRRGPRWIRVEPKEDKGIVFDPPAQLNYCTRWLHDELTNAGSVYQEDYRAKNPNSSPIVVGALSPRRGGVIDAHRGHGTGLACDLRIPRKDGGLSGAAFRVDYDKQAARAQMIALHGLGIRHIVFNDKDLVDEGLCQFSVSGKTPEIHVQLYWLGKDPQYWPDSAY